MNDFEDIPPKRPNRAKKAATHLKPGHWQLLCYLQQLGDDIVAFDLCEDEQLRARKLARLGLVAFIPEDGMRTGCTITDTGKHLLNLRYGNVDQ